MLRFNDALYGRVELPDWLLPFIKLPEFVRLRGVRLSNVDSVYFKDFAVASRWEHGIAVASLAHRCATRRGLSEKSRIELTLAALLHDVGTPPFAHTIESVLANFDHEIEGQRLLEARPGADFSPDAAIFQSQLPQFHRQCDLLSKMIKISVDPDEVAKYVSGDGELGFLINGAVDLDNADNITRASLLLGLKVSPDVPLGVTDWLACQDSGIAELSTVEDASVREWIAYRDRLYTAFFEADEGELGRMAFLQHLMRRGMDAGLGRRQFIWATDDDLMNTLSKLDDGAPDDFRPNLKDLVQRYRLLESPVCLSKVNIEDIQTLRVLRHPDAVAWITRRLRTAGFEPMVLVMSRRFGATFSGGLLPDPVGALYVFHLGRQKKLSSFNTQIRSELARTHAVKHISSTKTSTTLATLVQSWCVDKPWSTADDARKRSVMAALESVGDWGFRLSRNNGFHAYPSTFVHALAANLLVSLGMKDDLVLDPFGGTGQTAIEAVKYGNSCITADINSVACLVAKARLTYIPRESREYIANIDEASVLRAPCAEPPEMELMDQWFHRKTLRELSGIAGFIQQDRDEVVLTFLRSCLSAILPSCTARRGEQHGYFADNCPLGTAKSAPPYQPAIALFLEKVQQALSRAEKLYGFIGRQGLNPEEELRRASVRQVDIRSASASSYGLRGNEVGAIITSPPYLCMADYALGQRLSYAWLFPKRLNVDFGCEIGARRLRLREKSEAVIAQYYRDLESFGQMARSVVRDGGFVALVIGQPVANHYREAKVFETLDNALRTNGFDLLWQTNRPIHWHRNHGYARLKSERVSVHVRI